MGIKAILFDKDGTLIDVNRTWIPLYRHMLMAEFGEAEAGANVRLAHAGYDVASDSFKSGSILAGGTTRQLVDIWWPDASVAARDDIAVRIDRDYAPLARQFLAPLVDLPSVLDRLRSHGFQLGVGTNDAQGSAQGQMEHLGIADRFTTILGYDSVSRPKPSGEMIVRFAELVGLSTSEIAMVGDNTHDLEEAEHGKAGLAIGVLSGNGSHADLAPLADHVISDIAALPDFLQSL